MPQQDAAPTVLVVFGATGDLMARKIVPSLFHLSREGLLPPLFRVVGFSRRDWSDDDLRAHVKAILAEKYPSADALDEFLALFTYQRGTFADESAYAELARFTADAAREWGTCTNKLFYLAVPPQNYETILGNLASSGLTAACSAEEGYTRVLVEKPFGHDVSSSKALDDLLASLFREEQIYRIDHYLAKEMLQGILTFRFHNDLLESDWNRETIERIDISLLETLGVENRGAFYDGVGALRDVGQNHLLQMLALVSMEQPAGLDADSIRAARGALLGSLRPLRSDEVARRTYRAQYDGYRQITGVDPESETETYFKLETVMTGPRWAGVPVTFESGKRVGTAPLKRIVVTFRHRHPCLCGKAKTHLRNQVIFTLEPNDTIEITFWAKRPGFDYEVEKRTFDFALYEKTERLQYVAEYAKLLYDAVLGDQTAFVSTDEVRAMWAFIDPVIDAWREGATPLETYAPDTEEPVRRAAAAFRANERAQQVGIAGLGKMGAGIALNLADHGWEVVGWNRTVQVAHDLAEDGIIPVDTLEDLVAALRPPRTVWLMVPAGRPVDTVLFGGDDGTPGLADLLEPGDIVIDGGNSHYADDAPRAARLAERGISFLDCGTSGGPAGARTGACLMIGGDAATFERVEPVFADVAVRDGYRFFDGVGSGHFVKMVHNGIEYGIMQAYAEGFELLQASDYSPDLRAVAHLWNQGSVIRSWLLELSERALEHDPKLETIRGSVDDSGEGRWTVHEAVDLAVPAPVIAMSLFARFASRQSDAFSNRLLAALRREFGGHAVEEHKR